MNILRDPRDWQIASLTLLLTLGLTVLSFDTTPARALIAILSCLAAQFAFGRITGVPRFDPRSALISGTSLALLMRTDQPALIAVGAVLTIGSKFVLRLRRKHVFNPTNFGIVAMLLLSDRVWVSPGQWGSTAFLALLFACAGGLVVHRACRSDVTFAFLGVYLALLFGRSLWLGEPMSIPLHRLESGALLLFAFFMISDPKTTPDSREGRIIFGSLVAVGALIVQFRFFRTNGLLWSLAVLSPLVPLLDRLLPGTRYEWTPRSWLPNVVPLTPRLRTVQRAGVVAAALVLSGVPTTASAFCGFYVAKADSKLFNRASQVVIARDGDRTVMTMANDYEGDPKDFAVVIPVPTRIERGQIHVADRKVIDHLHAYSAPRLVEYFDGDPCLVRPEMAAAPTASVGTQAMDQRRAKSLGVTIEAKYTVGEYDILVLSAEQSSGLETWLRENGYRIPAGAGTILGSYIRQKMRFFVARVNLTEQARLGITFLSPLQIAYTSPKFMLPIRLGTVNARGPQELFVYTLTRKGRVETTNYRTVRLPTDVEVPAYVKQDFTRFYKAMFSTAVRREQMSAVFLEYAWDMAWCDPCAADPLSREELRQLGVFWLGRQPGPGGGENVFLTRLHVRYDAARFPEDLVFQETGDRTNFQGRYVIRHPWTGGTARCEAAREYRADLSRRLEREAQTLSKLTGWKIEEIRSRMKLTRSPAEDDRWWEDLWDDR